MSTGKRFLLTVLVLALVVGFFPAASLAQGQPPSQAVTNPDVNYDGNVNVLDLTLVGTNFGKTTVKGDTNFDGKVDLFDLVLVGNALGKPGMAIPAPAYQTKADPWPAPNPEVEVVNLPDEGTAKVQWYKQVGLYVPLFAVAVANPIETTSFLVAAPEVALVGAVIVGGFVVYKIYERDIANALKITKATITILAASIAALTIVIPQALPGVPNTPDHVANHPRGDIQSAIKTAAWITIWNAILKGIPPDWCGRRTSDGAIVVVFYNLAVAKITGGLYKGLAIIFNYQAGNITTLYRVDKGQDGPRGNEFLPFIKMAGPCNPWSFLLPAS